MSMCLIDSPFVEGETIVSLRTNTWKAKWVTTTAGIAIVKNNLVRRLIISNLFDLMWLVICLDFERLLVRIQLQLILCLLLFGLISKHGKPNVVTTGQSNTEANQKLSGL